MIKTDPEALPTEGLVRLTFGTGFPVPLSYHSNEANVEASLGDITIHTVTEDELDGGEKGWLSLSLEQVSSYLEFNRPDSREGYLGEYILYTGGEERYPLIRPAEADLDACAISYTALSAIVYEDTHFPTPREAELAYVRIWRNEKRTEVYSQFWLYDSSQKDLLPSPDVACNLCIELQNKLPVSGVYMEQNGDYKGVTEFYSNIEAPISKVVLSPFQEDPEKTRRLIQHPTEYTNEMFFFNGHPDNRLTITYQGERKIGFDIPDWAAVVCVRTQYNPERQELLIECEYKKDLYQYRRDN